MTTVEEFLGESQAEWRHLDDDAIAEARTRWRRTFAREVGKRTGETIHCGYEWHAFSYGFSPALEGDAARERLASVGRADVLVLSAMEGEHFGYVVAGELPDFGSQRFDMIVIAQDFTWTVAFTHERQCGPYFAVESP